LLQVSASMLPLIEARPLTLFRWPEGLVRRRVLQKHWEIPLPDFVDRVDVFSEAKRHDDEYALCNNLATLVWLAQMGTLEIHVWHSRIAPGADSAIDQTTFAGSIEALDASILNFPDYVLFDIDPYIYSGREARGAEPEASAPAFAKAKEVAYWLKEILDAMSLESLVKTSGKTGLHVVVPIRRVIDFDATREMAKAIGEHLVRAHRDVVTMHWSVEKRRGKVFFDANMNARGKSMTAPYGPRGLPGAPVSMPIEWDDLETLDGAQFRIPNVASGVERIGTPWANLLEHKQDLERVLAANRRA